jgi:hypothetical protein
MTWRRDPATIQSKSPEGLQTMLPLHGTPPLSAPTSCYGFGTLRASTHPTLITITSFALGYARRLSWYDPEKKDTGVSERDLLDHGVGRCFGLGRACSSYLSTNPIRQNLGRLASSIEGLGRARRRPYDMTSLRTCRPSSGCPIRFERREVVD